MSISENVETRIGIKTIHSHRPLNSPLSVKNEENDLLGTPMMTVAPMTATRPSTYPTTALRSMDRMYL